MQLTKHAKNLILKAEGTCVFFEHIFDTCC